ncbi:PAS domain S-box protein [Halopenitus salinus]|uniref:PAS domain S-box protein n=1 Tax=Halopenitus salinus TaxID=1198295 RepID=A0ABD5UT13_9EURY
MSNHEASNGSGGDETAPAGGPSGRNRRPDDPIQRRGDPSESPWIARPAVDAVDGGVTLGEREENDGRDPRTRIAYCLTREGHERLLVSWLEERGYEPVRLGSAEMEAARFDLCIVDRRTLGEVADVLTERQRRSSVLLPTLLLTSEDTGEALAALPAELAAVVTDVVSTPLRTPILKRRLEGALRTRRLSRELAGSRERYRRLLEHTPAAVFLVRDGRIEYVNAAGERTLGVRDGDVQGERFVSFVDEADRDRVASIVESVAPGAAIEFVDASLRRNEYAIPAELAIARIDDEGGDTVQILAHDISRRQAREEQLKLYRRAMDAATVGISITNPSLPDNPLIYVNDEFERLTGYSRDELLGRNPRVLQTENTDPETVDRLREAIDAGEPVSVEIRNGRPDGTEWHNQLDITPIEGDDGEVEYFLGFQRDVSDRHEREQRLAVLDRVLRHDLRNRLNLVTGHAAEIGAGNGDPAEHAAAITRAADSLISLADAARRFRSAMRNADVAEQVRIDHLITEVVDAVEERQPDVHIDCDLRTAAVRSNGSLKLAIEELLSNAIEHAGADATIEVLLERAGDDVLVHVVDDGPGIPVGERNALEGTAETPTDHDSGMGLWLVRWAVEAIDGAVSYVPNEPRGSIVTLHVPIVEESDASAIE